MNSDNLVGELGVWALIGGLISLPFIGLAYIVSKGVKLTKIRFRMYYGDIQETPPLCLEQQQIFQEGLKVYVKQGKVVEHSITVEKVNTYV